MKAPILISVFAALVLSVNVNAKNVRTYSNVEIDESGTKKEYISLDSETLKPQIKENYYYDIDGRIIEKTISKWVDTSIGWVNSCKYEYHYGESGLVTTVAYTKWNSDKKMWSYKSELLINIYDENNNFMASRQVQVNNKSVVDIAQK